ncbi:MAG: 23S rRNA (uracil(1939)-C(5))-methyltransferase RlmD [Candidatus Obscuribacterales bacterium]|nr:23S rRNA (uracil(1939)-C(5))-methyltransferase RlmD [Candidatus Obscuribacterales bacterium]
MSKARHSFRKNQILEGIRIDSIAPGGQGFCKSEGLAIFVDRAVPGDIADLELYDVRKDFAHARITKLKHPSNLRQEPPCKLFKLCGGCQWQHIKYEEQLNLKTDMVKQLIGHMTGIDPSIVKDALEAENSLHYRNKVQYPVSSPEKSSRILAGYYKEASHELINIKHCPVQPELLDRILEAAKEASEDFGLSAYKEKTHSGLIRHFIARHSVSEDTVLLTLVLNLSEQKLETELEKRLKKLAEALIDSFPGKLKGVCINFNDARGNRIMGKKTRLLGGADHIIEELSSAILKKQNQKSNFKFRISTGSFFQVNSKQAEILMDLVLQAAKELAESLGKEKLDLVIDAFAGVASMAIWVSPLAHKVIAIEEVEDAIKDAELILQSNSVENVKAICGTVESVFPQLSGENLKPDLIILDPPRKGVDRETLICAAGMEARRIVYVSCNPATLARDLKILSECGYKSKSIQPLDLFPQTYHIESVTVLDRQKID